MFLSRSVKDQPHNIVVCCDGTWCGAETGTRGNIQIIADGFASQGQNGYVQTFDGEPVYNSSTNTDICYFNGVGLDGLENLAKEGKQLPLPGLLGGFGDTLLHIAYGTIANDLPERCKEAYGFIMDKYKGPDLSRVWVFGVSRGAYTVRAVAGMINNCGILDPAATENAERSAALQEVWKMYRSHAYADGPGGANAETFRASRSWPRSSKPPIIFMGLLDTVGAEGIPRIKPQGDPASAFTCEYCFRDPIVSSEVQHVFQAVSTHDRLAPFEPCAVRRSRKLLEGEGSSSSSSSVGHYPGVEFSLQEVWFPGAHHDIGRQDFVFSNQIVINNGPFRMSELGLLRTNVVCTPELADYPLLGRALPAHGGPSPPPRHIGIPSSTAAALSAAEPAVISTRTSSTSGASGSASGGSSSSWVACSELCLVAQVNKIQPGMLPPADDSAWEDLVKGRFASLTSSSRGNRLLGLTSGPDMALLRLRPLLGRQGLLLLDALLDEGINLQLQPAYTIDAEDRILRPLVPLLTFLLDVESRMLLKDRHILRLAKYDYGPVKQPNFFQVPADSGGHGSFWSSRSGNCSRGAAWFQSRAYDTCYAELFYLERNISLLSASPVGEARLPMPKVPEVYTPSRPQQTQQQQKEMLQEHDAAETAASAVGSRRSDLLACCISSGCDSSTASELLAALYFSDYEAIQDLLVEPAGKLGLVALLSSSYHDVQQAAADAVAILGKQVDISSCDDASLHALSACSGLTPPGFGRWLATRKSGMVLLSRQWGLQMSKRRLQMSLNQQKQYAEQIAESGYVPLAETHEGLLLALPAAWQCMQDALDAAAQRALFGVSSTTVSISSGPCTDDPDGQPSRNQSTRSVWQWLLGGGKASDIPGSSGDNGGNGQGEDGSSSGQGSGGNPSSGTSAPVAAVPRESCMACELSLPRQPSVGAGLAPVSSSCISKRATSLVVEFACKLPSSGITLKLGLMMAACLKAEGDTTKLGYRLERIEGRALHIQPDVSDDSSSSSKGTGKSKDKRPTFSFIHQVRATLEVQRSDGMGLRTTGCNNPKQYPIETGSADKVAMYRTQESNYSAGFTGSATPSGTLNAGFKTTDTAANKNNEPLPLVQINTAAVNRVSEGFYAGSAPCTVKVSRAAFNTMVCGSASDLGAINSNPDNDPDFDICYSAEVPADCLDSGGLRNDAVEVKLAVAALAGTVRRVGLTRTNHDMQEVKVDEPGQFVASTVIKLSQPVDVQKGPTQCKVHTAAAAKGPNSA